MVLMKMVFGVVCVVKLQVMTPAYVEAHFSDIQKYACVVERRLDDSACTKEVLLADNAHYRKMCETWGYPCILIDRSYRVELPE